MCLNTWLIEPSASCDATCDGTFVFYYVRRQHIAHGIDQAQNLSFVCLNTWLVKPSASCDFTSATCDGTFVFCYVRRHHIAHGIDQAQNRLVMCLKKLLIEPSVSCDANFVFYHIRRKWDILVTDVLCKEGGKLWNESQMKCMFNYTSNFLVPEHKLYR